MTRSGRLRSYWSAIGNSRGHLFHNTSDGVKFRAYLYHATGKKRYQEETFNRNLKTGRVTEYTTNKFRTDLKLAKQNELKSVRRQWRDINKRDKTVTWKRFKAANYFKRLESIEETYNSP